MSLGSFFVEAGMFLTGIVPVLGEFTLGGAGLVGVPLIPIFIVLFPDESNALWLKFAYLLNPEARDYPDIPIYEGTDLNTYRLFIIIIQLLLILKMKNYMIIIIQF